MTPLELSVVSPFFNEEDGILAFCAELRNVLDEMRTNYEVILVDDGSTDESVAALSALNWPECRLVRLVGNSGHQNALDAGLQATRGEWVATLDSDLQHPPSVIRTMLDIAKAESVDVVYAVREDRSSDGAAKRWTATAYYKIMCALSGVDVIPHSADFRLMSTHVVQILNGLDEEKVFRLLVPSLGFPSSQVKFRVDPRYAGESKYSFTRMMSLAVLSAVSFSPTLLRWVSGAGVITALLSFVWLIFVIANYFLGNTLSGWASLMGVVLLLSGCQLLATGLVGEYVSAIHVAGKRRPRYIVRSETLLAGDTSE